MNSVVPANPKEFFEKPSTIILFKMFKDNRGGGLAKLDKTIKKITKIRSEIKMNLND